MKKELLSYLVCPVTHEELALQDAVYDGEEIKAGKLVSKKSRNVYPIVDYVPVMLTPKQRKDTAAWEEWATQWKSKHFQFDPNDADLGIPLDLQRKRYRFDNIPMAGKVVLESGCGGGRLTPAFYSKDAKAYLCLDISSGVYHARSKHKGKRNVHFIRGDLERLPFKDNAIDVNVILGVIQHSADMQQTISEMGRTLVPGGTSVASIYMTPTNLFVRFKVWYCDKLRKSFKLLHLPEGFILWWAKLSVLAFNGPFLFRPLAWAFYQQAYYNRSDKFTWMLNYDFYHANTFQYTTTREESLRMYLFAGLTPVLEPESSPNSFVLVKHV